MIYEMIYKMIFRNYFLWNYNFSHEKRFQHFDVVERSPDHAYVIIIVCEKNGKSRFLICKTIYTVDTA